MITAAYEHRAACTAAALAWMALIFFLSSQATLPLPPAIPGFDKIAHFGAYGVLGALLMFSMQPKQLSPWQRVALVTLLVCTYGASDEFHQSFVPGRDASILDWVADGFGGFVAALILRDGGASSR
ncbi:MAG: VanZ family protein [Gammaproteobacteria bacterium]|nr:VanZ family protein [Gammaproteobacteria bacterium]